MPAQVVADQFEALLQLLRLPVPHMQVGAERMEHQQRRSPRPRRVFVEQLGIFDNDRLHSGHVPLKV